MSARDRILERVHQALTTRGNVPHPGPFGGWRPEDTPSAVEAFRRLFEAAGGEVVRVSTEQEAHSWMYEFGSDFESAAPGQGVPEPLRPPVPSAPPSQAGLGVSMARCAVAETGSLVLGSEDGRGAQLLPPTHVVFIREADIYSTLCEALTSLKPELPSALGLHSGPSKSADIGQILVKGVHGPGRVVAVLIGRHP